MGYLDNLKIDRWFKAVAYMGGIILLLSLTVSIQVVSNEVMATIGFGLFSYGIGRWKNTKTVTEFIPGGKLSQKQRIPDIGGLLLELLGALMILGTVVHVILVGL